MLHLDLISVTFPQTLQLESVGAIKTAGVNFLLLHNFLMTLSITNYEKTPSFIY